MPPPIAVTPAWGSAVSSGALKTILGNMAGGTGGGAGGGGGGGEI